MKIIPHGCEYQMQKYIYPNYTLVRDEDGNHNSNFNTIDNCEEDCFDELINTCDLINECRSISFLGEDIDHGHLFVDDRHHTERGNYFLIKNNYIPTTNTTTTETSTSATETSTSATETRLQLQKHRLQLQKPQLQLQKHRLPLQKHRLQLQKHRLQLQKHRLQLQKHRLQLLEHQQQILHQLYTHQVVKLIFQNTEKL